jgi:hypothetical protein
MSDLNYKTQLTKTKRNEPPFFRQADIAAVTIVAVDSGRLALSCEVELVNNSTQKVDSQLEADGDFQGVVDIEHAFDPVMNQMNDNLKSITTIQDDASAQVEQRYLTTEPNTPTENEPYPNKSPLLAYN